MKLRWIMSLVALVALLAVPVIGTAQEDATKEATKEKCCEKGKCAKGSKCCAKSKCCKKAVAIKLDDIKCPISGHDIDADSTVDHNGGKVFLCCDHCLDAWKKDMAKDGEKKFLVKANYQLVATGQAKQKGCPMSGGKIKDGTQVKVGPNELEIGFCCKKCTKAANDAEGDSLLAMIFSDKSFAKAFSIGDEDEKETK